MDLSTIAGKMQALEKCPGPAGPALPEALCQIVTPLKLDAWEEALREYPDQPVAELILRGIREGFRVGFIPQLSPLQSRSKNMSSAREHADVVSSYLAEELRLGRIASAGSAQQAEALGIHCNPFGVIPKRGRPGKWRLIVNLSAPEGHSVNDGIVKELASLSYVTVEAIAARVLTLGRGTLMAKMDIKHAYRNIPVHPQDRPLLGMLWEGQVFLDATLPFGLRSAPLIFTVVADALQWMMEQRGGSNMAHYIDDFITMGAPGSLECSRNHAIMHETCEDTGFPYEPDKDEGPATAITFTGVELDSVAMELRLPLEKLARLKSTLGGWRGRKACRKRELLSLIGVLAHACKVVRSGRPFLRRLIDLSMSVRRLDQFVRLNWEARSDVEWWWHFCEKWNGIGMMRATQPGQPSVIFASDASGNWGCGAFCNAQWFMLPWSGSIGDRHITVKEFVPITLAAALWGSRWRGQTVLAQCDNTAVVEIVNKGTSRDKDVMHLVRCLAFIKAKYEFELVATHVRGVDNPIADALSRDKLPLFRSLHPQAAEEATPISPDLLDLLLLSQPDWTSPRWTGLWTTIF